MIRHVIEFEDGSLGEVTNMFNRFGDETSDRQRAEAIVAKLPCGLFMTGEVQSPEGLHPVQ